ncbi:hypothetical protein BDQ17DRAFT_1373204, partial [Cyathus striatus]
MRLRFMACAGIVILWVQAQVLHPYISLTVLRKNLICMKNAAPSCLACTSPLFFCTPSSRCLHGITEIADFAVVTQYRVLSGLIMHLGCSELPSVSVLSYTLMHFQHMLNHPSTNQVFKMKLRLLRCSTLTHDVAGS